MPSGAPAAEKGLGSRKATGARKPRHDTVARRNGWNANHSRILNDCAALARHGGGSAVHVDSTAYGPRITIEFKHSKESVSPLVEADLALRLQAVTFQQERQQAWINKRAETGASPPKERRKTRKRREKRLAQQLRKKHESEAAEQSAATEASSGGMARQQEIADAMAVDDASATALPAEATANGEEVTPSPANHERSPALPPSPVEPLVAPPPCPRVSEFRARMSSGWVEYVAKTGPEAGTAFFYHPDLKQSRWTRPELLGRVEYAAKGRPRPIEDVLPAKRFH